MRRSAVRGHHFLLNKARPVSAEDVACQLTLLAFWGFRSIQAHELMSKKRKSCGSIQRMEDLWNHIAQWVEMELLSEDIMYEERAQLLRMFVDIAQVRTQKRYSFLPFLYWRRHVRIPPALLRPFSLRLPSACYYCSLSKICHSLHNFHIMTAIVGGLAKPWFGKFVCWLAIVMWLRSLVAPELLVVARVSNSVFSCLLCYDCHIVAVKFHTS